jgi:hypothetical protein
MNQQIQILTPGLVEEDCGESLDEYLEQTLDRVNWTNRLKRVRMTQNIMRQLRHYCDEHVDTYADGRPKVNRTGSGGAYYGICAVYMWHCKEKGLDDIDGLPCFNCNEIIYERETCISMAKGNGKKYYHMKCAVEKGII